MALRPSIRNKGLHATAPDRSFRDQRAAASAAVVLAVGADCASTHLALALAFGDCTFLPSSHPAPSHPIIAITAAAATPHRNQAPPPASHVRPEAEKAGPRGRSRRVVQGQACQRPLRQKQGHPQDILPCGRRLGPGLPRRRRGLCSVRLQGHHRHLHLWPEAAQRPPLPSGTACRILSWRPTRKFTPEELAQYDGSDPDKPVYIAIRGKVFDVTAGQQYYGKGGGYSFFAGVDASRAYVTGCFKTHLTHDVRGLTEGEIKSIDGWADFYETHEKYFYVGEVIHDPIPEDAPLPEPC
ncbi:cytochrome b5-like heme/steroid binding domain-containing protein [Polychytrium aggregatum]|uniref:cytochrome b5-like heme/steroid binding domain-containing protein n=1 Tax=Polychytrium aggregatum TaxID=110093 RepID=UPI0022FEAF5F|nr:cytochrome b5-like heme/steroid binding domain-containing protein [Polychytrium aggregatum]KAI9197280.1 cytochrome b5-like heme/steroid binding domain-containing protein [Polychytrium aggregatum]